MAIMAVSWSFIGSSHMENWITGAQQVLHRSRMRLIVICGWFSIASLTAQGIQATPKALFEVARTLGAKTPCLVLRVALPQANPALYLGAALGVTFPFNLALGIPLYYALSRALGGAA